MSFTLCDDCGTAWWTSPEQVAVAAAVVLVLGLLLAAVRLSRKG
jgi:hypothetical protein